MHKEYALYDAVDFRFQDIKNQYGLRTNQNDSSSEPSRYCEYSGHNVLTYVIKCEKYSYFLICLFTPSSPTVNRKNKSWEHQIYFNPPIVTVKRK